MNEELGEEETNPTMIISSMLIVYMFVQNQIEKTIYANGPVNLDGLSTKFDELLRRYKVLANIQPWEKSGDGHFFIKIANPDNGEMESKKIK